MWDFELVTIEKSPSPISNDKGHWYRYTIANKITTVNGCRRGSKSEVAKFVNSTIQRLNTRHLSPAAKSSISL